MQNCRSSSTTEVETAITQAIENGPGLAMVNSDKGITNLHVLRMLQMPYACNDSYFRTNVELRQQTTRHDRIDSDRILGVYEPLLNVEQVIDT
jgi:monomeric isocitrate dehydrogenase